MRDKNVLGMLFIKHLLAQIPSVTLLADMTGPVCTDTDGSVLTAVSRQVRQDQFTVEAMEAEFANCKVALYGIYSCGPSWKAGDTIQIMDPVKLELTPTIALVDQLETFIIRYAKIPK
jgi:hypothetical protein